MEQAVYLCQLNRKELKRFSNIFSGAFLVLILLFVFYSKNGFSQNSFDIQLIINGKADSIIYLTRYQGERFQIIDTSRNQQNQFEFKGNKELPGGIYMFVSPAKVKLLEILIDAEQNFSIQADSNFNISSIRSNGNEQNALFIKHLMFTNKIYESIGALQKMTENQKDSHVLSDSVKSEIEKQQQELKEYRRKEISEHPDTYYAVLLKAMTEVPVPDSLKNDARKAFFYQKNHFWDNYDLSDSRLLHTPMLPPKLETYTDLLTMQHPDSVINSVEKILSLTLNNHEVRDYIIWHFTSKYQYPKIMGLDKAFIYLSDNYFSKTEIAGTSPSIRQKIMEKADQLRNLMIGCKAPDLWLVDTAGAFRSYHEIKSNYTVLFFWDHDCGICKKELNELNRLYTEHKGLFEVYAINVGPDIEAWKLFIKNNQLNWFNVNGTRSLTPDFHDLFDIYSTPVIYVLNEKSEIIAKRIKAEQLPTLFLNK